MIHENINMRNVTVSLDEKTARWARIEAARRDMSVSRLIREMLSRQMRDQGDYAAARRRYLERPARPLKTKGAYPSREEVHDHAHLR